MKAFFKSIFLVVFFYVTTVFSQNTFKPGYYIDNASTKINGLILDDGAYNNPTQIIFKANAADATNEIGIESIKEFAIPENNTIYKRYTVELDVNHTSGYNTVNIPSAKVKKTLLLKVLIEGEFSLYKLVINDKTVFFHKGKDQLVPIELENNSYFLKDEELFKSEGFFRRQLIKVMDCNDFKSISSFLEMGYNEEELVKVFKEYNTCKNVTFSEYNTSQNNEQWDFKFTPFIGASFSSLKYDLNIRPSSINSTTFTSVNLGFETSLILPFGKKKSEIFFKAGIENVDSEANGEYTISSYYVKEKAIFKSIILNLNLGSRYNFYLNKSNKLFIDASFGLCIPQKDVSYEFNADYIENGSVVFTQVNNLVFKSYNSFFIDLGMGYCINNKFGIDFHYNTNKQLIEKVGNSRQAKLSGLTTTLRYTIN